MTDIKLKERCQFCGGVGRIESHKDWQNGLIDRYSPACENPDCVGAFIDTYYETPEEAAEAWDRRASPWRTDPPPKDGSEILAKTSFGVRIVKWENQYVFPGACTFSSGWLIVGGNFLYTVEIQEWKDVPK